MEEGGTTATRRKACLAGGGVASGGDGGERHYRERFCCFFFIGREFRRAFQDSTLQQSILTLKAPKPQYYLTIHVVHQTSNGRNFFN
jgi:hypothetical protein